MCPCLWVVICYSSIHSSNIFMSRFLVITKDIYIAFIIVYYQYVRTYYTSVSMWLSSTCILGLMKLSSDVTVQYDRYYSKV